MFWGMKLDSGKAYKVTPEDSIQISSAVLDVSTADNELVQICFKNNEDNVFTVCNLSKKDHIYQVPLDIQFGKGEDLIFFKLGGKGTVNLLGNKMSDDFFDDMEESEEEVEEEEETEVPQLVSMKRKKEFLEPISKKPKVIEDKVEQKLKGQKQPVDKNTSKLNGKPDKSKKNKSEEKDVSLSELMKDNLNEDTSDDEYEIEGADEEDEEEVDDEEEEGLSDIDVTDMLNDADDDDSDDTEEEDEEDEDESEEDDDEEMDGDFNKSLSPPKETEKQQKAKAAKKTPVGKGTPKMNNNMPVSLNGTTPNRGMKKDTIKTPNVEGSKQSLKHQDTPIPPQKKSSISPMSSEKKALKYVKAGGVTCQDLQVGTGAEAKVGTTACVYYEGRLRKTNKLFDKQLTGAPMKFRLGKKEVIKGWEIGVEGMKVGGKRRLIIPPQMGYGKVGSPPVIPPNSALLFDIELKDIKK